MSYTRVNWQNSPDTTTPLSADNLNVMDAGIEQNASDIADLQAHTYDTELDTTSENAPQTKVVKEVVDGIQSDVDANTTTLGTMSTDVTTLQNQVGDLKSQINALGLSVVDGAINITYTV